MIDDHSLLSEVRDDFMVLEELLRTLSALGAQGRIRHMREKLGLGSDTKSIAEVCLHCGGML